MHRQRPEDLVGAWGLEFIRRKFNSIIIRLLSLSFHSADRMDVDGDRDFCPSLDDKAATKKNWKIISGRGKCGSVNLSFDNNSIEFLTTTKISRKKILAWQSFDWASKKKNVFTRIHWTHEPFPRVPNNRLRSRSQRNTKTTRRTKFRCRIINSAMTRFLPSKIILLCSPGGDDAIQKFKNDVTRSQKILICRASSWKSKI